MFALLFSSSSFLSVFCLKDAQIRQASKQRSRHRNTQTHCRYTFHIHATSLAMGEPIERRKMMRCELFSFSTYRTRPTFHYSPFPAFSTFFPCPLFRFPLRLLPPRNPTFAAIHRQHSAFSPHSFIHARMEND